MKTHRYIIILLFILAGILWLWGGNDPFVGIYNANNNYLALSAKNYFRFGYQTLHFLPTYFASYPLPPEVNYYLHHPILFFLIASIPFKLFGFHNWVVHVATGLFSIGMLYFIYRIGSKLWGKNVGLWSAILAALFPMASFFWKFMFFEQITMFFNLWILYLFLEYRDTPKKSYLILISLLGLLCMLSDWYALYLVFVLPVFLLLNKKNETVRVILVHGISVAIGLGVFLALIVFGKGNFRDLIGAVSVRSIATELFSLSYPYVRLAGITILRIGLYFTPLAFGALWYFISEIRKKPNEKTVMLLGLCILGFVNVIVLPTATWGHSYFLYPFIPFFAFGEALILTKFLHKPRFFYVCILIVIGTSIAVNFGKMMQVRKQFWKYALAQQVEPKLKPYETIGVVNFSGDVFEQYFLHPSVPLTYLSMKDKLEDPASCRYYLVVCADVCTNDELNHIKDYAKTYETTDMQIGDHPAWLIEKKIRSQLYGGSEGQKVQESTFSSKENGMVKWYRYIRDFLGVGQI